MHKTSRGDFYQLSPSPCLSFQSFDPFSDKILKNKSERNRWTSSSKRTNDKRIVLMTFFCDTFSANATFRLIWIPATSRQTFTRPPSPTSHPTAATFWSARPPATGTSCPTLRPAAGTSCPRTPIATTRTRRRSWRASCPTLPPAAATSCPTTWRRKIRRRRRATSFRSRRPVEKRRRRHLGCRHTGAWRSWTRMWPAAQAWTTK